VLSNINLQAWLLSAFGLSIFIVDLRAESPVQAMPSDEKIFRFPASRLPNHSQGQLAVDLRVATLLPLSGQPEIMRDDLKRMIAVTARISGRDLGSTVSDVKRALARSGVIPNNVLYTFGGLYEQQQIAFRGLTVILIAAIILVFLLLLFLYESFRVAFAMLLVPIFAVAGVFIGLWITATEFNITSRMGMTMIVGIVTEITIFYYSEFRSLPASKDRLITAGINRTRAISMTTFAAILALLPLALAIGHGAAMQQPLAIAIISGLTFSLPLVLIVLPALLVIFGSKATTQ